MIYIIKFSPSFQFLTKNFQDYPLVDRHVQDLEVLWQCNQVLELAIKANLMIYVPTYKHVCIFLLTSKNLLRLRDDKAKLIHSPDSQSREYSLFSRMPFVRPSFNTFQNIAKQTKFCIGNHVRYRCEWVSRVNHWCFQSGKFCILFHRSRYQVLLTWSPLWRRIGRMHIQRGLWKRLGLH